MDIPLYIKLAPNNLEGNAKIWIDAFLNKLPKGTVILEVGSGTGRDAEYIEQNGYQVIRTDFHQEFVDHQKVTYDQPAYIYDIAKDNLPEELPQKYDAILVRSVLNHFSTSELKNFFRTLGSRINPKGYLAFNITKEFDMELIQNYLKNENLTTIYTEAPSEELWTYLICSKN